MDTLEEKKESEFGKGLTYNLGLFLAHAERFKEEERVYASISSDRAPMIWFNGASDHFYELDTSRVKDAALKERLETLKDKCLGWGHGFRKIPATDKDVEWSIAEAKACLLEIDRLELGVSVIKGSWE